MFIGNLFETHAVNVDIDNNLIIFTGMNGSGKTETMKLLQQYFKDNGEHVIYFPEDRILQINEKDMLSIDVANALLGQCSLKKSIEKRYDIEDQFAFEGCKKGEFINSGYLQLINFFYYLSACCNSDSIVIIDNIERSLHMIIQKVLLEDMLGLFNMKKLIITTYSPMIIKEHRKNVVDITDCVKLYE